MKKYPLPGVTVRKVNAVSEITNPLCSGENFTASQTEYRMSVEGVGDFYAGDGKSVEYRPESEADPGWVKLYLNGQVLVALLHQRRIINFHASSFVHQGRGIMILGGSGAGKSSVTASFALRGAGLLTDDITPVVFDGAVPYVRPLHGSIRIRRHTAEQLDIDRDKLQEAESGTGKQYLTVGAMEVDDFPLHVILKIEIGDVLEPMFDEPLTAEKFSLLRSEVCMWEILAGMAETETGYLKQLVQMIEKVPFVRVVRPIGIAITEMHEAVEEFLGQR